MKCTEKMKFHNGVYELRFEIQKGTQIGKILVISSSGFYLFENQKDCNNNENPIFECDIYNELFSQQDKK